MKTIKLKKLTLQDWRAQNRVVEFSNNTEIRGYNRSGKSSIYNAFLWLLTGADDKDRNNYNLFDNTIEQTHETSKVASVEGIFEIDNIEYTFKRTAKIGWTRKKGRDEYERKGTDDYKCYIDNIERSATEYKKTIEEMFAPLDKLKIMLNMNYFLEMDWKEMRKQLECMIGEIKTSDFKGDYSSISDLMIKFDNNTDMIKSHVKPKMKILKENVGNNGNDGKLSIEINTLRTNLPNINGVEEIQNEINQTKEQIADIDKTLLGSNEQLQEIIAKRNKKMSDISALEISYKEHCNKYEYAFQEKKDTISRKISQITVGNAQISHENEQAKQNIINAKNNLETAEFKLTRLNEYRQKLLMQNEEVKAMQFTDDKCIYCGQELPEDKLEEAKAKFVANKDAKHKAIVAEGKANNVKIEQCKAEIAELKAIIEKGYEEKPLIDKSELDAELKKLELEFIPYDQTPEGKEKLAEISNLKANLTTIPTQSNESLINMKKSLLENIEELSKKLGIKDEYNKQIEVIKQKERELKDSAIELARLEGIINKANEYEREKASIISDRVNGKFDYIKVEMTEINKSGELVDTCKILDENGVNALSTNFASRMRCAMDISTAFCNFYGLNLPMFVDFAESICEDNYPASERQTVKLIVDNCNFNVIC